ncbi:hypothetical protein DL96DRAFT_585376 [Flagelloscypha sp. PMI_526]|nr:hypothetical protein DL96DRAFT_585376 [Flagelloscypha sp. PMI_526]
MPLPVLPSLPLFFVAARLSPFGKYPDFRPIRCFRARDSVQQASPACDGRRSGSSDIKLIGSAGYTLCPSCQGGEFDRVERFTPNIAGWLQQRPKTGCSFRCAMSLKGLVGRSLWMTLLVYVSIAQRGVAGVFQGPIPKGEITTFTQYVRFHHCATQPLRYLFLRHTICNVWIQQGRPTSKGKVAIPHGFTIIPAHCGACCSFR